MTIQEAKEKVILAGQELVRTGLIARTWGNVSCRISESEFVITPSGRDYMSLTPDEIVKVSVSDLSYDSDIKPSSEKGVHAVVYSQYPDISFVIHTHQVFASAISASNLPSFKISKEEFPLLGGEVVCADYALPGTKKLMTNVSKALSGSHGKAVIMKHHGALCFGADYDEAFKAAHSLEEACKSFIASKSKDVFTESSQETLDIYERGAIISNHNENDSISDAVNADISDAVNEIFKSNKDINYIVHADSQNISSIHESASKLLPLLDDFAQIAGTSVRIVDRNSKDILYALKRSSAVIIKGSGAICTGNTLGDAKASAMVLEKNLTAYKAASLFGRIKYINPIECKLMRFVYLKKYSRQFNKK